MKRPITLALAFVLSTGPVFAQTPDRATEAAKLRSEARQWQWSGGAVMIGGLIYQILGQTTLAQENTFCTGAFNVASCTTIKDPNMGAVYGGAVMVGVGAAMLIVGVRKAARAKKLAPELSFSPHGFKVQKRIAF